MFKLLCYIQILHYSEMNLRNERIYKFLFSYLSRGLCLSTCWPWRTYPQSIYFTLWKDDLVASKLIYSFLPWTIVNTFLGSKYLWTFHCWRCLFITYTFHTHFCCDVLWLFEVYSFHTVRHILELCLYMHSTLFPYLAYCFQPVHTDTLNYLGVIRVV